MKSHLLNKNVFLHSECVLLTANVFKIIHAPDKRPPLSYDRFYVAVTGVA